MKYGKDENNRKVLKNGILISSIVCIGKVLGFLKQAVIAWAFGANSGTDIYFAADSYIAMFGQIQMASISPSVLIEYVKLRENKKKNAIDLLLRKCFCIFPVIALVLILINILFSGEISIVLGISYSIEQRSELQSFIIYLCPVILLTSFSSISQGILDGNEQFVPSKLLSLFFSSSIIIFIFLFRKLIGIKSMLLGFLIGYAIHTLYISILAKGFFSFGRINRHDNSFKIVLKNTVPLLLGNSIVDFGHIVDKIIASSLTTGSLSYLYYGQVISNDLVNAVIITSIGTVLLPSLAKMISTDYSGEQIIKRVNDILCTVLAILFPIMGLYLVEGKDLVKLFFERGSFTEEASGYVSLIAIYYSVGFVFIAIREVFAKVHYAYQDTITPMYNGILGVLINILMSLILSRFIGVSGIAIATSISMIIVAILMCFSLKKHIGSFPLTKLFWINSAKCCISVIFMVIIGFYFNLYMKNTYILLRIMVISFLMVLVYIFGLKFMKHDSIKYVKQIIR